jgi:peptide/nickel transport system permease protein
VIILSLISWPGLARVVRSKFLSLKNEDYVRAARVVGASDMRVIFLHMVPMFTSYLIASLTLSIPGMILGETSLSFLGIGLRPPAVSWGVLLSEAQSIRNVALYPWTLIPGLFIIITVMSFNFLGDGLRDAADPYSGI